MTAKEFLNRGYRLRERIAAKEKRIAEWERRATSTTLTLSPVTSFSSQPSKKVEDAACAIADLQKELQIEIQNLINIEKEIATAIESAVKDPTLKLLLELRYLNCLKWEEIAIGLGVTFRWTMVLHKKALKIFEESILIHI